MRILHINSARGFGGGEKHLVDLVGRLAARGHKLYVAHAPKSVLAMKLLTSPHIKLFSVRMRNALDIIGVIRLAYVIREQKIEIVHAHLARDYTVAAAAVSLANAGNDKNSRVKLIITRHVSFAPGRVHKLTFARASLVIAVSNAVAAKLVAHKLIDASKVRVVNNGIDFQRFDAQMQNFKRDIHRRQLLEEISSNAKFLVGTVGDLTLNKGHDTFVRAAKSVLEKFNDEIAFVIIGADDSPKQTTRRTLEKLIAELKLENQLHLLGRREDIASLLASLDVFVSASRTEAFGLALVEALACGVPVVATATDGAQEIINDETSGVIVPVGDADAMGRAIMHLLEDETRRPRFGDVVRARFSLERMVDETEAVYRAASVE